MSSSASAGDSASRKRIREYVADSDEEVIDLTQELPSQQTFAQSQSQPDEKHPPAKQAEKKRKSRYADDAAAAEGTKGERHFLVTLFLEGGVKEHEAWCVKHHEAWQSNTRIARWAMQVEKCPKSGKIHVQGYVVMSGKTTMTFNSFRKKVLDDAKGWVLKAIKPDEAFHYCEKAKSREAGPWVHGTAQKPGDRSDAAGR